MRNFIMSKRSWYEKKSYFCLMYEKRNFCKLSKLKYINRKTMFKWSSLLFVCLFVWRLSSHSRIFHSYGNQLVENGSNYNMYMYVCFVCTTGWIHVVNWYITDLLLLLRKELSTVNSPFPWSTEWKNIF